ncbi:amidohydrolase family protein, partial [Aduncisulcus paluster]
NELLRDEKYRRRFRKEYESKFGVRVWHRDFFDAEIVACPDQSVVGKSFGQVGVDRGGLHPVDAFLDLVLEHGTAIRWRTTISNHRPEVLKQLAQDPGIQIGFSDAGAHLRNMAFYNFGLRLLRHVREAQQAGQPFMTIERAYAEHSVAAYGGLSRMVNRNDATVSTVLIGGRAVVIDGQPTGILGKQRTGSFLRAGEAARATVIHRDALTRFGCALSDSTRAAILLSLRARPGYPSELAEEVGVSRQITSNHLACLRGCGLVVAVPEGRRTRYELADERIGRALDDLVDLVLTVDPSVRMFVAATITYNVIEA